MEVLRRIDAARREINATIMMFLNDYDAVATHTVAAAGLQIVSDLAEKDGKSAGVNWMMEAIIPEKQKELLAMFRAPQNFFKHADHPGNEADTLEYRPESLESYIMLACLGYHECTGMYTPEMRAFMLWVGIYAPQIFMDSAHKSGIEEYIKNSSDTTPAQHKQTLIGTIKMMREQQPRTLEDTDYS